MMKTKMMFTFLITMCLAGINPLMAQGQIQPKQKATVPLQLTTVHKTFAPVKVTDTELKTINKNLQVISPTAQHNNITVQRPAVAEIEVLAPINNDVWEAGNEYVIKWTHATQNVKIDLVTISAEGNQTARTSIASQVANTGSYRFKVPYNWVKEPRSGIIIESMDGKQKGVSQGTISVYTQPVNIECMITDINVVRQTTYYVVYAEGKRWVEYNVLMRNKGILTPLTIQNVLVRLIKDPENVVVYQEEWGFSGIYYHNWYRLPGSQKINISSCEVYPFWKNENINFESGSYRLEIELDPTNMLGEAQETRYDNKDVQHWKIQ